MVEGNNCGDARRRPLAAAALIAALLVVTLPASRSAASPSSVYFAATGYVVAGPLQDYWQGHGQLAIFGYPISRTFASPDGATAQFFERNRLEAWPDGSVTLGLLGDALTQGQQFAKVAPFPKSSKHVYFATSGHSLNNRFLAFWKANGGLAQFGYPISEPTDVGNGRIIQWFERARFEWSDSNPDLVLMGLLGREYVAQHPLATAQTLPNSSAIAQQAVAARPPAPPSNANPTPPSGDGYAKWQALPGADKLHWYGWSTYFSTDWETLIRLNKGWGNLPPDFHGSGMYAAIPEDTTEAWHLYGHKVRITYGDKSVDAQLIDVIAYRDIKSVRAKGIVVDLSEQVFAQFAPLSKGMLQLSVKVLP